MFQGTFYNRFDPADLLTRGKILDNIFKQIEECLNILLDSQSQLCVRTSVLFPLLDLCF